MKNFLENIDDLLRVNCAISDYYVEFTLNNLNPDEKLRSVQLDVMLPMFKSYRVDSEKYHSEGKLKKLQSIYNGIEKEASENIMLEQYVFEKIGIKLGMRERYNRKLNKIIERGKLKNENEYHMIMDQINILCQLKDRDDEVIDNLNTLIIDFEKKYA
ncbi:hypothetical protein [uncultured Psychroserpens sp.]|uniref:hypothetical protein n=1 Tax=uncultured Psychroserpens sp. TaxID=255436 RepID=UPI00260CECC2|nr:hypothetical protein [uncultured Psychroserpens sp.]